MIALIYRAHIDLVKIYFIFIFTLQTLISFYIISNLFQSFIEMMDCL